MSAGYAGGHRPPLQRDDLLQKLAGLDRWSIISLPSIFILSGAPNMEGEAMTRQINEQELAEFLFDRLIVHGPSGPDTEWLRPACQQVATELLEEAEITYRESDRVLDGGA